MNENVKRPDSKTDLSKAVKKKIHQAIQGISYCDITQRSSNIFKSLESKEIPTLEEVDFYRGYKTTDSDYVPRSVKVCQAENQQKQIKHVVKLSQIFQDFKKGQITFIGPAGSGKTTLLKYIAHGIITKKWPSLKDVEYVHFLQGRDLCSNLSSSLGEFLSDSLKLDLDELERREYVKYVHRNSSRVIFIIDSLDTLPFDLVKESQRMSIHDSASPARILWNLLTGNLFRGCKIITSSREHKIRNFRNHLRADRVIALVGLTFESIRRIVVGYLGKERGENFIHKMKIQSPSLMTLCATPVFLSFNLMSLEDTDFVPNTMSGIVVSLLRSLIRSEHTHVHSIEGVLQKLAWLSFVESKNSRVVFPTTTLRDYGLKEGEVTDLTVLAPAGRTRLLQHENVFFFCHQSVQEALSALHISQMPQHEFESFVNEFLHGPQYAVIRRFLCGIMLNEEVLRASRVLFFGDKDLSQKQAYLKESLKNQLCQVMRGADELELIISFTEAGKGVTDVISSSMQDLDVQELPLLDSDVHAVGSVLRQCTYLNRVSLRKCSLNPTKLQILASCIKDSKAEINELNLWGNDRMEAEGMSCVGSITKKMNVKWLGLGYCDLTAGQLEAFGKTLGDYKLAKLVLWANKKMGSEGMANLGNIVRNCYIKSLGIGDCNLGHEVLFAFLKSLGYAEHLSELDIRYNHNLGTHGMRAIGQIAEQCSLQLLNIGECSLTEQQLRVFVESAKNAVIAKLYLHGNKTLGTLGISHVGEIVRQSKTDSLHLGYMDLGESTLMALKRSLGGAKVSEISFSENKHIGSNGMKVVGEIVKECQVTSIDFANCNLRPDDLSIFEEAVAGSKLSRLNLHDNEGLGNGGMSVLGRVVRRCQVQFLNISDCSLSQDDLSTLKDSLQTAKLCVADMGVSVLSSAKIATTEEVDIICQMLPQVTLELRLERWKIKEQHRKSLQEKLNHSGNPDLKIIFGQDDILTAQSAKLKEGAQMPAEFPTGKSVQAIYQNVFVLQYFLTPAGFYTGGGTSQGNESKNSLAVLSAMTDVQKILEKEIGPDGGQIEIDGCTVTFPVGAVDDQTRFRFSLSIGCNTHQAGFVTISPMMTCHPSMAFNCPVKITLPTWCSTDHGNVIAKIMCQNSGSNKAHILHSFALVNAKNTFEFECNHFSSFWAQIRSFFLRMVEFKLLPELYYDLQGNFSVAFHVDNVTASAKCQNELSRHGFEPAPVTFGQMILKASEEVPVHLHCRSHPRYVFDPHERKFKADESWVRESSGYLQFVLTILPMPRDHLRLICRMRNRDVEFGLVWREPAGTVFTGEVKAENMIIGPTTIAQGAEGHAGIKLDSFLFFMLMIMMAVASWYVCSLYFPSYL